MLLCCLNVIAIPHSKQLGSSVFYFDSPSANRRRSVNTGEIQDKLENPSEPFTANLVPDYGNPKKASFGNLAKRNFPIPVKIKGFGGIFGAQSIHFGLRDLEGFAKSLENPSVHFIENLVPYYGNPKELLLATSPKEFSDSCKNKRIWRHFGGSMDPFRP
ncbi:hypothetical protein CEXT_179911 [Caerostris extrusa]|uniref:Uncharacterized protein n=1 Tax=Caerostris extrusa TaxID=172846 RepID=A0AAV4PPP4_CAEEX|nr:hypothetical protein CEXT_179911 [Caerostris extrusa]